MPIKNKLSLPASGHQRAVIDAVRRIVQALRRSSHQAETRIGLTAAQLFVLQKLAEKPGASVNELAALTLTNQSSVSLVVKKLVTKGLLVREHAAADARRVVLGFTPRGRAALRESPDAPQLLLLRGLHELSERDQRRLADSLTGWLRAMRLDSGEAAMLFEDGKPGAAKRRIAAGAR